MIKIGDLLLKDIRLGTTKITAAYIGSTKIYPNISYVDSGIDYGDWVYADPVRTRTATPWTQDVYADGSRGPKVYGTQTTDRQTATTTQEYGTWSYTNPPTSRSRSVTPVYTYTDIVREGTPTTQSENSTKSTIYGDWVYNITTATGSRTRTVTDRYQFTDTYKDITQANQTENGTRSVGAYTYNWAASTRTATVTYTFTDANKTIPLTESGTVTYNPVFTYTNSIPASGGSVTFPTSGTTERLWNGSVVSGQSTTVSVSSVSGTSTGFTVNGRIITAASFGTTLSGGRSISLTVNYSVDGKSLTTITSGGTNIGINQLGNKVESSTYVIDTLSANPTTVSSNGGTSTITTSGTRTDTYSSGAIGTEAFTPNLSINSVSGITLSGNILTFTSNASSANPRSVIVTASYPNAANKTITVSQQAGVIEFTATVSFMFNQTDENSGNWYMTINTNPENIISEVELEPLGTIVFEKSDGQVKPININSGDYSTELGNNRLDLNPPPSNPDFEPKSGSLEIKSKNSKYVCTNTTVFWI